MIFHHHTVQLGQQSCSLLHKLDSGENQPTSHSNKGQVKQDGPACSTQWTSWLLYNEVVYEKHGNVLKVVIAFGIPPHLSFSAGTRANNSQASNTRSNQC
jgi:hypothetical protein